MTPPHATTAPLAVRPAVPDDRGQILELLATCLAAGPTGERTPEFFAWKHDDNPFGPSPMLVAESEGVVVGLRAFMRWELRSAGRTVRAVRAVDTATHPAHQGQGIFKRLTLGLVEEVSADTDLVFNTPNDQSRPGYLRMGWSVVEDVPVGLRVARPLPFARGARSARSALPAAGRTPPSCGLPRVAEVLDDPGVASLVEDVEAEAERGPALRTARTLSYLTWRYSAPPGLDYRAAVVRGRGGQVLGLLVGRPRWRGDLAELTVGELLVRRGDRSSRRRLLAAAAGSGVDHLALVSPGRGRLAGLRDGCLSLPGARLTMTTRPLRPTHVDPLEAASWDLALGDLELF